MAVNKVEIGKSLVQVPFIEGLVCSGPYPKYQGHKKVKYHLCPEGEISLIRMLKTQNQVENSGGSRNGAQRSDGVIYAQGLAGVQSHGVKAPGRGERKQRAPQIPGNLGRSAQRDLKHMTGTTVYNNNETLKHVTCTTV